MKNKKQVIYIQFFLFVFCFVFSFIFVSAQNVTIDSNSIESWYAPLYLNARTAYDISVGNGILYINTATDKIGINKTTPAYTLDVQGSAYFANPLIVGTPLISSDISTKGYADFTIAGGVGSGTSGQTLKNNGSGWFGDSTLFNDGTNIGVGITNPTTPFSVYNSASAVLSRFQTGSSASFIRIGSTGSSWQIGATGSGLQFYNDNTSQYRMTVTSAGSVGIGTASPSAMLHVTGTGNFASPVLISTTTASGQAVNKAYVDSLPSLLWLASSTNIYSVPSGNVGIGVTTPAAKLDIAGTMKMTSFQLSTSPTAGSILVAGASGIGTWQSFSSSGATYGTGVMKLRSPITLVLNSFTWETNSPASVVCPTGYTSWYDTNYAYWYADLAGNATYEGACYNAGATTDIFSWKTMTSPNSVVCPTGYTRWVNTSFYGYGIYSSQAYYSGVCYKGSPTTAFNWESYTGLGTPTSLTCPTGYTKWFDSNAQWYSSGSGYYSYVGACYNTSATNDFFRWKATTPANVTCPTGYTKWYPSDFVYGPGNNAYTTGICYKGSPNSFTWDAYTGGNIGNVTCPTGYTKWYDANALWRTGNSYNAYTGACISNSSSGADAINFETMAASDTVTCPTGYTKYKSGYYAYKQGSSIQAWDGTCYKSYDATVCPSCPSEWSETTCQTVSLNGYDAKEKVCYRTDTAVATMQITKKGSSQSVSCPSAAWAPATSATNIGGNTELACYFACPSGMTTPGIPTSASATAGPSNVTLIWTAPSGTACAQAESYKIYRSTTSGSGYTLLASDIASTTYVDSAVSPSTTPTYTEPQSTGNRTALIAIEYDNVWNYSGYPDTNMIDGNGATTAYISNTAIAGLYITFDFKSPKIIKEARYTWSGGGAQSGVWKWQASNDNYTWTDVSASFTPNASGNPQPTILGDMSANSTAYRYYRWIGVSGTGYNNGGAYEIEFKILGAGTYPAYYYKVSAVNGGGEGTQGSEVSATPAAPITSILQQGYNSISPITGGANPCKYGLYCSSVTVNGSQETCVDAQFTRLASWANPQYKLIARMMNSEWDANVLNQIKTQLGFSSCTATNSGVTYAAYHSIGNGVWSSQPSGYALNSSTAIDCAWNSSSNVTLYDGQSGQWSFGSQPTQCAAAPTPPAGYLSECNNQNSTDYAVNITCTR